MVHPSGSIVAAPHSVPPGVSLRLIEIGLEGLLSAHKAGSLDAWLSKHPRLAAWIEHRLLKPVRGVAGDALEPGRAAADALSLLLCWAVTQQRPDRRNDLVEIDRTAWLDRTSWRPLLALACQFGFAPVPDFRDRYRRGADESAASNLCGLWAVGPSTFYRYLDKGRRAAASLLKEQAQNGRWAMSLRMSVAAQIAYREPRRTPHDRREWHRRQAADRLAEHDPASALWHLLEAPDDDAFVRLLVREGLALAAEPDTDALVEAFAHRPASDRRCFDLWLARASLARTRADEEGEREAYRQAQHVAARSGDKLMLGIVHGALGKFHEARDADHAFAHYQQSAELLWEAGSAADGSTPVDFLQPYVSTLVRLAWLYVLRNDPRSKAVLQRADQLRAERPLADEAVAMLEQTWGEYWRRAGEPKRAIEYKHRALALYERLGDRPAALKTASNLALIYGEAREFERAIDYSHRVLSLAETTAVEPEIVAATRLNLGVAHFWRGDYPNAMDEYAAALQIGMRAGLRLIVRRAHYNLAEACYIVCKETPNAEMERRGDAHAAAALDAWPDETDPAHVEATRNLKREILGPGADRAYDRLLPQEFVAHYAEMEAVQRQRVALALPGTPEAEVRAHLAIAGAYLAISAKEREAALAIVHKHGLLDRFTAEFEALRSTFDRGLTREQHVATQWRQAAGELVAEQRRIAVLEHLFHDGAIQKSVYARLCGVGLATASKHLAALAERGLLVQSGKGPSTRYTLPPA